MGAEPAPFTLPCRKTAAPVPKYLPCRAQQNLNYHSFVIQRVVVVHFNHMLHASRVTQFLINRQLIP